MTKDSYSGRGGKREGAGRKITPDSEKLKNRTYKLSDSQHEKVMKNGGAKWLRKLIDEN